MGGFHCFGCQDNNLEIAPPKERPPTTTAEPTAEALGLRLIPLVRGSQCFHCRFCRAGSVRAALSKQRSLHCRKTLRLSLERAVVQPRAGTTARLHCATTPLMKVFGHWIAAGWQVSSPSPFLSWQERGQRAQSQNESCFLCGSCSDRRPVHFFQSASGALTACRLGAVAGRAGAGKPSIVLTKDYHVWLLNPTSEPMQVVAGELFGFGTGQYSNQVVLGALAFHFHITLLLLSTGCGCSSRKSFWHCSKEFCIDAGMRQFWRNHWIVLEIDFRPRDRLPGEDPAGFVWGDAEMCCGARSCRPRGRVPCGDKQDAPRAGFSSK